MVRRYLTALAKDKKGSVALIFGLAVPMLIGFTGLAIDGTFWLKERNRLQSATDGSAISAAQALELDGAKANLSGEARKLLTKSYGSKAASVTLQVLNPPSSGAEVGNNSAVEVISQTSQQSFFLGVMGIDNVTVRTRAVARIDSMADACLLSLSPGDDKAINITGNATVSLGCGIASNSVSSEAIYLAGGSVTTTTGLSAVGDVYRMGAAKLTNLETTIKTHTQAVTDPYGPQGRNIQAPAATGGCTGSNLRVKGNTTLTPGRYCGGIDFQNGTATLEPGVYVMDAGDFSAGAQAKIVGNNVTIILTASNANNIGQLNVNGGADLSLQAPQSGTPYDGILFYQDRLAPTAKGATVNTNVLNGNASLNLSGALYFPSQGLDFSGAAASNIACLQLVAYTVKITGNSKIGSSCQANNGTTKLTRKNVELVE